VANLLYLVHRIPYPPNKGDKLRSYHILKHLASRHRVFLGTFADDPADLEHVAMLRELCADVCVVPLNARLARLRSISGFAANEPLTVSYYRDATLARWVDATLDGRRIDACVVFSSAMAQYLDHTRAPRVVLIDFVDVDSAKWTQYAAHHRWPLSWVYRREGARLLEFESAAAERATRAFFVTDAEAELFRQLAPGSASRVETIGNGVDTDHFSPSHPFASPFAAGTSTIVFTGAMDYWPNIDAVGWFASRVLPPLRALHPDVRFAIVGMRPAAAVRALAGKHIIVTGVVPDVRPYLRHAAAVVAPLRVARGIQNKILEAMAMARPVVATEACAAGVDAADGKELLTARDEAGMVSALDSLLRNSALANAMGNAARERVLARYTWDAQLARFESALAPSAGRAVMVA